jgi:hypothetical protein
VPGPDEDGAKVSDDERETTPSTRFRYHLELSPAQLKITHTALHALLDDFGHEESDVRAVIQEVLGKLPDEHAIRAIQLDTELESELNDRGAQGDDSDGGDVPPAAA